MQVVRLVHQILEQLVTISMIVPLLINATLAELVLELLLRQAVLAMIAMIVPQNHAMHLALVYQSM